MADNVLLRMGEKRLLRGTQVALRGTITADAPPTFSLYDLYSTLVPGFRALVIDDYPQGPATQLQAVFDLDTARLPAPGYYYAAITHNVLGSDGEYREIISDWDIFVRAAGGGG